MRLQMSFRSQNPGPFSKFDTKVIGLFMRNNNTHVQEIECDQILAVVFTMHGFYVAKIMGADPEFLKSSPLS